MSSPIFYPRPEAQATTWDELMTPVSSAVRDLLVRIHGAHQSTKPKDSNNATDSSTQQTGNCFLVYGSRGTGKTTVLLNAKKAICRKSGEKFFGNPQEEKEDQKKSGEASEEIAAQKTREAKEQARTAAKNLCDEGLVWLEILNLEPLPSEANLLTVLLTQVRNALHSHCGKRQSERRSIFEEEADSARQQLNNLINDATLMWQNIKEQDTRNISSRQVKAADIYAGFQEQFKNAMDKLVGELSDTPHSLENKLSIVLPIDNIDRSTDHLQSIVKLAQLVSHPNLWLVMAGDRIEVETFLERAYWKELIRSSDGAGAQGKIDSDGEDEALVMARRQANATAQKLWPANHRIEVDFVKPEETLKFEYKQNSTVITNTREKIEELLLLKSKIDCPEYEANLNLLSYHRYSADGRRATIRDLLEKIKIPTRDNQRDLPSNSNITLLDLFDVTEKVEEKDSKERRLTRVAYHGLLLPARSVLDLWQLLDWLTNDSSSSGKDFKAEKIVRTMLRAAIASSNLPSWIAQDFQNRILQRGEKGGSILYFDKISLQLIPLTTSIHDFEHALAPVISKIPSSEYKCRSQLVIRNVEDITLSLQHNYSPIKLSDSIEYYPQRFIENVNKKGQIELPPLVAAWLMALYDILILAETDASSWVKDSDSDVVVLCNVSIRHTIVTQAGKFKNKDVDLSWNAPKWGLFLGRNIFGLRWQDFRKKLVKNFPEDQTQQAETLIPRLLAAGWILCVLKTSIELITSIDPCTKKFKCFDIPLFDFQKHDDVSIFENNVMQAAMALYQQIQEEKKHQLTHQAVIPAAYEVMLATGEWLETELICFLSSGYVPLKSKAPTEWVKKIWQLLEGSKDSALQEHWQKNLPFILAELDEKLKGFEEEDDDKKRSNADKKSDDSKDDDNKEKTKSLAELLFANLYEKLNSPDE